MFSVTSFLHAAVCSLLKSRSISSSIVSIADLSNVPRFLASVNETFTKLLITSGVKVFS